jgi:HPt (histidine-containing phosphotransfer) domain-containing protein
LIRLFLDRVPEQMASLAKAVEQLDAPLVRAVSHKIKGSAIAVAANPMSQTAAALQHHAEQGNLPALPRELRRLEQQYGVVCDLLKHELAQRAAASGASAS